MHPVVKQRVPRPRVITREQCIAGEQADIGDTTNIDDCPVHVHFGKHGRVEGGRKGSAFAACGDIAASEVRNGGDAGALGNSVRVTDLEGKRRAVAC